VISDYNERQYRLILDQIRFFKNGQMSLSDLISRVEALADALENADLGVANAVRRAIGSDPELLNAVTIRECRECSEEEIAKFVSPALEQILGIVNGQLSKQQ
jgi:hypothetical protein